MYHVERSFQYIDSSHKDSPLISLAPSGNLIGKSEHAIQDPGLGDPLDVTRCNFWGVSVWAESSPAASKTANSHQVLYPLCSDDLHHMPGKYHLDKPCATTLPLSATSRLTKLACPYLPLRSSDSQPVT